MQSKLDINGVIGVAARLVLAGVWIVAGALKLPDLGESVLAVRAYQMLPYDLTTLVGYALPIIEIGIGTLLLLGLFTRFSAAMSSLLMLAFVIAISSVWMRGISIDCGCFGGGGEVADAFSTYPWEIARDVALGGISVWLSVSPKTPYSLDSKLVGTAPKEDDHDL